MCRVLGIALAVLVMLQPMALCVLNVDPWTWCLTTLETDTPLFWHTAVKPTVISETVTCNDWMLERSRDLSQEEYRSYHLHLLPPSQSAPHMKV